MFGQVFEELFCNEYMDWPEILAACDSFATGGSRRRTAQQVKAIDAAIILTVDEYDVMTVRQLYYQLVSRGIIPKTEASYDLVVRRSGDLRRNGHVPYRKFADATRWMRKPITYESLQEALEDTVYSFRRDLWNNQDTYVEIWCEKDALAGVLHPVTSEYDVPLMVSRGYASLSFLHSAAEQIQRAISCGKDVHLYQFGDHDPSGVDAANKIEQTLREMGCNGFSFERAAVTVEQIAEYSLPTRPTKTTDSRAKGWQGGSVEVDAIDPNTLKDICEQCIAGHIDQHQLDAVRAAEIAEQDALQEFVDSFPE